MSPHKLQIQPKLSKLSDLKELLQIPNFVQDHAQQLKNNQQELPLSQEEKTKITNKLILHGGEDIKIVK